MKLLIERDRLLNLLIAVTSVVERRQTLPILANVLVQLESNTLTLVGTDLEVEASIQAEALKGTDGQCTVAAEKCWTSVKRFRNKPILNWKQSIAGSKSVPGAADSVCRHWLLQIFLAWKRTIGKNAYNSSNRHSAHFSTKLLSLWPSRTFGIF